MSRKEKINTRWVKQFRKTNYKEGKSTCYLCGVLLTPAVCIHALPTSCTVDHIKPLSKGGSLNDPRNLALACMACNTAKGDTWGG